MKPLTRQQREAIWKLYNRDPNGSKGYLQFRRRFHWHFGDYVGGAWCGMFVGIELDGYTHT